MFAEYLKSHPLRGVILSPRPQPFPRGGDGWATLPRERKDAIRALAARWRQEPYPLLTATQYMAFARSGDRAAFEAPYFRRRRKLCAAALGACLEADPADMDAVIDGLWLLCEESSWVVSAHNGGEHAGVEPTPARPLPETERPYVDLFAAQTAMILSLVCSLLAEPLDAASPMLRRRAREEIERRVLTPFETRDDFWWMGFIRKDLCNWTPWIVSNVMLSATVWLEDTDRLCGLLERGCAMLDRYLDAMPADGGCDEGPAYWSMAGGALLDCLELLERVTGGKMTFWHDEKLVNILRFPLNAWLGGEWFVNFADCDARPAIPGERLRFAGRKLGDPALAALGARFDGSLAAHLEDTPQLWRLLNALFRPECPGPQESPVPEENLLPGDVWLPDLQMRVVRRDGVTLACKGGVNQGSHNHNDCGSFLLYADGFPVIVDAGNMTYTAATFSENRYGLWNIRSAYHNVPRIGPFEQAAGWDHGAADVVCDADGLTLDLARAYPAEAGVARCLRRLSLAQNGALRLTDDIGTATAAPVGETFLVASSPSVHGGAVFTGGFSLRPDTPMAMSVEEIPVTNPRMARNWPGSLWRVIFTDAVSARHNIGFSIERDEGHEQVR